MNDADFGKALQIAMVNAGTNNTKLAEDSGISARLISKYRTGDRHPSWRNLKKLVNALGCQPGDLL